MSKNMQLTVTIKPYYKKDLEGTYANLGRCLRHLDADLVSQSPSLYDLAGQVDRLLYRFDGTPLRNVLLLYRDRLRNTYKEIQENMAEWNLTRVDQLLYRLEDMFDDIDSRLA